MTKKINTSELASYHASGIVSYRLRRLESINTKMLKLADEFVRTYKQAELDIIKKFPAGSQGFNALTNIFTKPQYIRAWGEAIKKVYGCGADGVFKKVCKASGYK